MAGEYHGQELLEVQVHERQLPRPLDAHARRLRERVLRGLHHGGDSGAKATPLLASRFGSSVNGDLLRRAPGCRSPPLSGHGGRQCMDGASPFGKAAAWSAWSGQDGAGQTPPPPAAAAGSGLRADAPAFIPPPTAHPPAPPGAKGPPPAAPYIRQQLVDAFEIQLQLRQIRPRQEYGRWVRRAFADLVCRGNRREVLIRCVWAWRATAASAWDARDPEPGDPPRGGSAGPQRQSRLGPSSSSCDGGGRR